MTGEDDGQRDLVAVLAQALHELATRAPKLVESARMLLGSDDLGADVLDAIVSRLFGTLAAVERGGWSELSTVADAIAAWVSGLDTPADDEVARLLAQVRRIAEQIGRVVTRSIEGDAVDPRIEAAVRHGLQRWSEMCVEVALGGLNRRT